MDVKEKVRRRYDVAHDYFETSEYLSEKLDPAFGSSATLLAITAFEIYLKAVRLADQGKANGGGHCYLKIWNELSCEVKEKLLSDAQERFAGHANYSNFEGLMDDWRAAFADFRYSYEVNEERSAEELETASKNWESPDFAFHPMELRGLNEAMQSWLENYLSN